jgi:hypothetical protein
MTQEEMTCEIKKALEPTTIDGIRSTKESGNSDLKEEEMNDLKEGVARRRT